MDSCTRLFHKFIDVALIGVSDVHRAVNYVLQFLYSQNCQ